MEHGRNKEKWMLVHSAIANRRSVSALYRSIEKVEWKREYRFLLASGSTGYSDFLQTGVAIGILF